jgi:hypothetical protein
MLKMLTNTLDSHTLMAGEKSLQDGGGNQLPRRETVGLFA